VTGPDYRTNHLLSKGIGQSHSAHQPQTLKPRTLARSGFPALGKRRLEQIEPCEAQPAQSRAICNAQCFTGGDALSPLDTTEARLLPPFGRWPLPYGTRPVASLCMDDGKTFTRFVCVPVSDAPPPTGERAPPVRISTTRRGQIGSTGHAAARLIPPFGRWPLPYGTRPRSAHKVYTFGPAITETPFYSFRELAFS
jgi:hypothetical protein